MGPCIPRCIERRNCSEGLMLDNCMNNKVLNGGGYDVLKYMMALLIVAIHARAFYGEYTSIFFKPLTEIAVPVFFILSSFFYFRKLYYCENIWSNLFTYLKRIGLLYLLWFCVNIPVILHYKHYFILLLSDKT